MATPPGPRPHLDHFLSFPLLTLDPAEAALEALQLACQVRQSLVYLLFLPGSGGSRWLFLPSGGSPEVSFDLQIERKGQQEDGEVRGVLSASDSFLLRRRKKKNPLLKQLEDAGENCGSLPVPGWRSSLFSGTKLEKGLKFPQVEASSPSPALSKLRHPCN